MLQAFSFRFDTLFGVLLLSPGGWYGADLRYFPGDPPHADLELLYAPVEIGLCLAALTGNLFLRHRRASARLFAMAGGGLLLVLGLCSLVAAGSVLYCFSPAWKPVRTGCCGSATRSSPPPVGTATGS